MSQVKVSGNASGTGIFEIAAPNSNTNRTLTLPDNTGTLVSTGSTFAGTGPAFTAAGSSTQTFGATTWTKIVFQTETYDTNSCYDNATNYRFTPTVAGYYQMNLSMSANDTGAGGVLLYTAFYKNGVSFTALSNRDDNGQPRNMSQSVIIYCNGSTDYIEVYGYTSGGTFGAGSARYFSGAMVRAA